MNPNELPNDGSWKSWLTDDASLTYEDGERQSSITFPVYDPISRVWIVYKPWSQKYMIVGWREYREQTSLDAGFSQTREDDYLTAPIDAAGYMDFGKSDHQSG